MIPTRYSRKAASVSSGSQLPVASNDFWPANTSFQAILLSPHHVEGSIPVEVYWGENHFSEQRKEVTVDLGDARVICKRPLEEEWDRNTTAYATIPVEETYVFGSDERRVV